MSASNPRTLRMAKEMEMLSKSPPHGISCWAKNETLDRLEAVVQGSVGSPYENGSFHIDITIPNRYPFEPPLLKFLTKVYHPNIDNSSGLICMDLLKMPPTGNWRPAINLSSLLTSVQLLLAEPNPSDPLDAAIAKEFIGNKQRYVETAKLWTQKHAMDSEKDLKSNLKRKSDDSLSKDAKRCRHSTSPESDKL